MPETKVTTATAAPDPRQGVPAAERQTVILVHGTFAAPDPADAKNRRTQWYEEEHAFVAALDHELAALGSPAACWKHGRRTGAGPQSFAWSGENDWLARRKAAESLRAYLFALAQRGWETHLVAHSHGGNVVMEALNFFETGIPDWFRGKIVLFGTPILKPQVKLHEAGFLYYAARLLGVYGLWLAAVGVALFWDRSWWWEGQFLTLVNLVVMVLILLVMFVILLGHYFYEFYLRPGREISEGSEGADPVVEHLLIIGSQWDEGFQLLLKAKNGPNPLLRKDATAPEPVAAAKSKRGPVAIAHETAMKAVRDTDRIFFGIERRGAYWLALAVNLVIAACAVAALAGWVEVNHWIAVDVVIIAAVASWAINRSYLGAWLAATGLPLRVCFWVGSYCWRMLLGIAIHLGDRRLRDLSWSTLCGFAFGLSGSPLRLQDVDVHKSLPWDDTHFTYLELPHEVVARVMQARADAFRTTSVHALEQSLGADPNVGLVHSGLLEIASQPLVHTCYYGEPLCIRKAAQWIAAPLRHHRVEIAWTMGTMQTMRCSFRDHEDFDPRFDDPQKAWTL